MSFFCAVFKDELQRVPFSDYVYMMMMMMMMVVMHKS